ncbi:MAG TPA: twin transmembrane helix small protein [Burkholderiales bacterium]|nr:twin transmembrane helix small protein [Burkholderiales bacterium]
MRIIVIVFLLLILGSLFSALFYLLRDKGNSTRTVKALTWRVALSITLFILLMAGYYTGLIPHRL